MEELKSLLAERFGDENDPRVREQLAKFQALSGFGDESYQVLVNTLKQQNYQKRVCEQVLIEDLHHYAQEKDPQHLVVWKKFYEILETNRDYHEKTVAKEKKGEIPPLKIKAFELAKHSPLSFEDLKDEGTYDHRYILCKVISDAYKSPNHGSIAFLVKDLQSVSNRVIRVSIYDSPSSWGLFCF
jgi:hypothetical protein